MKPVRLRQRAESEDEATQIVRKPATLARRSAPASKPAGSHILTFADEGDAATGVTMMPSIVAATHSAETKEPAINYASILQAASTSRGSSHQTVPDPMLVEEEQDDPRLQDMAEKARAQRAQLRTGGHGLPLARAPAPAPAAVEHSHHSAHSKGAGAAGMPASAGGPQHPHPRAGDAALSPLSLVAASLEESCTSARLALRERQAAFQALEAELGSAAAGQQELQGKVHSAAQAYDLWQTMYAEVRKHALIASSAEAAVSRLYAQGSLVLTCHAEALRAYCAHLWGESDAETRLQHVQQLCGELPTSLAPLDCTVFVQSAVAVLDPRATAAGKALQARVSPSLWMEQVTGCEPQVQVPKLSQTEDLAALNRSAHALLRSLAQSCLAGLGTSSSSWTDVATLLQAMQAWKVGPHKQLYADTFAYMSLEQLLVPYVRVALFEWASDTVCSPEVTAPARAVHDLPLVQQLWAFGEQRGEGTLTAELSTAYDSDEALVARLLSLALPAAITLMIEGMTAYQPWDDALSLLPGSITGRLVEAVQDLKDFGGKPADLDALASSVLSQLHNACAAQQQGSVPATCLRLSLTLAAALEWAKVIRQPLLTHFVLTAAMPGLTAATLQCAEPTRGALLRTWKAQLCPALLQEDAWETILGRQPYA